MQNFTHISDFTALLCRPDTLLAALRPPHCLAPFWLLDVLLEYSKSFWSPVLSLMHNTVLVTWHPPNHSSRSSLPGALVVTRSVLAAPQHLGYSRFFGASQRLRNPLRFSASSCPLSTR